MTTREPAKILLAEDNYSDVLLLKVSLEKSNFPCELSVAANGEIASKMLKQEGDYAATPKPDIIILDINMPLKTGHQLLEEIKKDDRLKKIPVIMLTGSKTSQDVDAAYSNHASGYIVKPMQLGEYGDIIDAIERYWFSTVSLPPAA